MQDIEDAIRFDMRLIYIMENNESTHNVIKECINNYILPYQYETFTMITNTIIKKLNLDISVQYLDGTKLEANANKYKFVWKPTTFHKKLDIKIKDIIKQMNYDLTNNELVKSNELYSIFENYLNYNNIVFEEIPNGKGKRLTKEEKM